MYSIDTSALVDCQLRERDDEGVGVRLCRTWTKEVVKADPVDPRALNGGPETMIVQPGSETGCSTTQSTPGAETSTALYVPSICMCLSCVFHSG